MGSRRVQKQATDEANFGCLLGQVDIWWACVSSYQSMQLGEQYPPSMSEGLSRSILRMRPVESAKIKTLLATCAATKSDEMEN